MLNIQNDDKSFMIFSSHDPSHALKTLLSHSIPVKELVGSYKGKEERSFISPAIRYGAIKNLGILAAQESVLFLNKLHRGLGRSAWLYYIAEDRGVDLGDFRAVSEDIAKASDGWTFDPSTDQYFVAS